MDVKLTANLHHYLQGKMRSIINLTNDIHLPFWKFRNRTWSIRIGDQFYPNP